MSLDASVPPTDHLTHLAFIGDSSIQEAQSPSFRSLEVKYYNLIDISLSGFNVIPHRILPYRNIRHHFLLRPRLSLVYS